MRKVLSEVSPRYYMHGVYPRRELSKKRRRHLKLEKESTETRNDGDRDKQNEDTTNLEKEVEQESRMDQEDGRDQDDRVSRKETSQAVTPLNEELDQVELINPQGDKKEG